MITDTPAHVALEQLKSGNRRYVNGDPSRLRSDDLRRDMLARGQRPFAAILTCADSRVIPELLFDQRIGDLFVVRVAGNVANSATVASLEYAVTTLQVRLIVVKGHEQCGAVQAAMEGGQRGPHLDLLLSQIEPALAGCGGDLVCAVMQNARHAAAELLNASPILSQTAGLVVEPACYWFNNGQVTWLNETPSP